MPCDFFNFGFLRTYIYDALNHFLPCDVFNAKTLRQAVAKIPQTANVDDATVQAVKTWSVDWADFRPEIAVPTPSAAHWDREGAWVADPLQAPSNPVEAKVASTPPVEGKSLEEVTPMCLFVLQLDPLATVRPYQPRFAGKPLPQADNPAPDDCRLNHDTTIYR